MNGKGSSPRNCFSEQYRNNYDNIKGFMGKKTSSQSKVKNIMALSSPRMRTVAAGVIVEAKSLSDKRLGIPSRKGSTLDIPKQWSRSQ